MCWRALCSSTHRALESEDVNGVGWGGGVHVSLCVSVFDELGYGAGKAPVAGVVAAALAPQPCEARRHRYALGSASAHRAAWLHLAWSQAKSTRSQSSGIILRAVIRNACQLANSPPKCKRGISSGIPKKTVNPRKLLHNLFSTEASQREEEEMEKESARARERDVKNDRDNPPKSPTSSDTYRISGRSQALPLKLGEGGPRRSSTLRPGGVGAVTLMERSSVIAPSSPLSPLKSARLTCPVFKHNRRIGSVCFGSSFTGDAFFSTLVLACIHIHCNGGGDGGHQRLHFMHRIEIHPAVFPPSHNSDQYWGGRQTETQRVLRLLLLQAKATYFIWLGQFNWSMLFQANSLAAAPLGASGDVLTLSHSARRYHRAC